MILVSIYGHIKHFDLKTNPIDEVPLQRDYERVRERALTDYEVTKLWQNIDAILSVDLLIYHAVKLVIACGGQCIQC